MLLKVETEKEENKSKMENINEQRWMKLAGILNEEEEGNKDPYVNLEEEFDKSPDYAPYNDVLGIFESYEYPKIVEDFKIKFAGQDSISKQDYYEFAISFVGDSSEWAYIQANWINMWDSDIYEKAGLI